MTLGEAIEHCKEERNGCSVCNKEHEQLYYWLLELQLYRESQPGVYKLIEDKYNKETDK